MGEYKKNEYEEIYKNYAGIVYGYLLKKCYREELAEELTQQTFFIAIKNWIRMIEHVKSALGCVASQTIC